MALKERNAQGDRLYLPRSWYDCPDSTFRMLRGPIVVAIFTTVVLVVITAIVLFANAMSARSCSIVSQQYHRNTHYVQFDGCYIDDGTGRYVSADRYTPIVPAK